MKFGNNYLISEISDPGVVIIVTRRVAAGVPRGCKASSGPKAHQHWPDSILVTIFREQITRCVEASLSVYGCYGCRELLGVMSTKRIPGAWINHPVIVSWTAVGRAEGRRAAERPAEDRGASFSRK